MNPVINQGFSWIFESTIAREEYNLAWDRFIIFTKGAKALLLCFASLLCFIEARALPDEIDVQMIIMFSQSANSAIHLSGFDIKSFHTLPPLRVKLFLFIFFNIFQHIYYLLFLFAKVQSNKIKLRSPHDNQTVK